MSKIVDRVSAALENLVTLEIITAVGQVDPKKDGDPHWPSIENVTDPEMIVSKINLLDGDVQTIFGEAFVTGDYQSLQAYHTDREKQGHQIIKDNIAALQELLKLARNLDGQQ